MTCQPAFTAERMRRLDFVGRAFARIYPLLFGRQTDRPDTCGHVLTTDQRPENVVMLLSEREILMAQAADAKRQHKRSSTFDARIREITHKLMEAENGR